MAQLFLCAAGGCQIEALPNNMILVRDVDGGRHRFCCYRHAAEWLTYRAVRNWTPGHHSMPPPSDPGAPAMMRDLADRSGE